MSHPQGPFGPPDHDPSKGYGQPAGYGQPSGYGPPAGPGYGAPEYAPPGGGMPYGYGPPTNIGDYCANWGTRAGGFLIDLLVMAIAAIPMIAGYVWVASETDVYDRFDGSTASDYHGGAGPILVTGAGYLILIAFNLWQCHRQGKTGQTIGKSAVNIRVVRESDGMPTGFWLSFGRYFAHALDTLACYVGWLWPAWDAKKQTFADKVCSTVVIKN